MSREKEKKTFEFSNFLEFREAFSSRPLPQITGYVSIDSYEFEEITEFYREWLRKEYLQFETIVFTGETGDLQTFFSQVFNPDMFYPTKLLIIRSGLSFFKPFIGTGSKKTNDLFKQFTDQFSFISDKTYILFHYDHWDIPQNLRKLFQNQLAVVLSKSFFANQTKQALEKILKYEDLSMSPEAMDEFLFRTPPYFGHYLKNIRKLRMFTNRKKFELSDIEQILITESKTNYQELANYFFQFRKQDFFREFSKITDINAELGTILAKILERLNELRIFKIYHRKFHGIIPQEELFLALGMGSYSQGRKYHIFQELSNQSKYLTDFAIMEIYNGLIDLNFKHKFSSHPESLKIYSKQKFLNLFSVLENK